jgi:D-cysteine desulfhydrase
MKLHPHEPPRVRLANLPTPLMALNNLAARQGLSRILMKQDELTGLELSGNKIRKLEYVVAEALAHGADTLVTHGGAQSNHCRATAAVAARLGLKLRLILRSSDQEPTRDGNLFLDELFGAECSFHSPEDYNSNLTAIVAEATSIAEKAGRKPYFFPVGASTPLGCWGYIRCVAELVDELGRDAPVDVYCATSSGGTQAGLILGKALLGCESWSIRGVPVSDSSDYFRAKLRSLMDDAISEFDLKLSPGDTPIELVEGFIGEGYAVPYPEAVNTIRLLGRLEGIILEPSYTSKAMTGMLAELPAHGPERIPVFIHTGGAFGLFARRDLLT